LYNWLATLNVSVEWELKFQAPDPPFKTFRHLLQAPQPWLEPTAFGNE